MMTMNEGKIENERGENASEASAIASARTKSRQNRANFAQNFVKILGKIFSFENFGPKKCSLTPWNLKVAKKCSGNGQ